MVYRIIFDPKKARWLIQIKTWSLFWDTIQCYHAIGHGVYNDRTFETFGMAEDYLKTVGLDARYTEHKSILASVVVMQEAPLKLVDSKINH